MTNTLTAGMDNVLAWRLGRAHNNAAAIYIIARGRRGGIIMGPALEKEGFGLVQLDPDSTLFGGRQP